MELGLPRSWDCRGTGTAAEHFAATSAPTPDSPSFNLSLPSLPLHPVTVCPTAVIRSRCMGNSRDGQRKDRLPVGWFWRRSLGVLAQVTGADRQRFWGETQMLLRSEGGETRCAEQELFPSTNPQAV